MNMSRISGFFRFYGRQLVRGWRRLWGPTSGTATTSSEHRRRTGVQRSVMALIVVGFLGAVAVSLGNRVTPNFPMEWNTPQRAGESAGELGAPAGQSAQADVPAPANLAPVSPETPDGVTPISMRPVAPAQAGSDGPQMAEDLVDEIAGDMDVTDRHPKVFAEPVGALQSAAPPASTTDSPAVGTRDAETTASGQLPVVSASDMVWPVSGSIVRPYGWYRHPVFGDWRHTSSTAILPEGDDPTVRAALSGRVRDVVYEGGLWRVSIEHAGGLMTEYEGLEAVSVASYAVVSTGAAIGTAPAPTTGRAVSFKMTSGGAAVDPERVLGGLDVPVQAP